MTDDEKAALADVYERAAEYLEKYGWKQRSGGKLGRPRCFIGATWSVTGENSLVLWEKANRSAERVLELSEGGIMEWNDTPGRTADEVINTLHALANKLR